MSLLKKHNKNKHRQNTHTESHPISITPTTFSFTFFLVFYRYCVVRIWDYNVEMKLVGKLIHTKRIFLCFVSDC